MSYDDKAWNNKPPWVHLAAPIRGWPGNRSPELLVRVAAQFDVENCPRYRPYGGTTFCNIYVSDVTEALGAEIPHWVSSVDGFTPAPPGHGNMELLVNPTIERLSAGRWGWKELPDSQHATSLANLGMPVVATYMAERHHHGHIAVVLPGGFIAQAGRTCFFSRPLAVGFGKFPVVFYGHT